MWVNEGWFLPVDQSKNDKLYCVQIIRKDRPNGTFCLYQEAVALWEPSQCSVINTSLINGTIFCGHHWYNTIQSNQFKRITLPAGKVNQYETELYAYFFKTSKYNRLVDKILQNNGMGQQNY